MWYKPLPLVMIPLTQVKLGFHLLAPCGTVRGTAAILVILMGGTCYIKRGTFWQKNFSCLWSPTSLIVAVAFPSGPTSVGTVFSKEVIEWREPVINLLFFNSVRVGGTPRSGRHLPSCSHLWVRFEMAQIWDGPQVKHQP